MMSLILLRLKLRTWLCISRRWLSTSVLNAFLLPCAFGKRLHRLTGKMRCRERLAAAGPAYQMIWNHGMRLSTPLLRAADSKKLCRDEFESLGDFRKPRAFHLRPTTVTQELLSRDICLMHSASRDEVRSDDATIFLQGREKTNDSILTQRQSKVTINCVSLMSISITRMQRRKRSVIT